MSDAGCELRERVVADFTRRFGSAPEYVARAPGRVNLIGEHTDYNDGFVLPIAIDRAAWIALRGRGDGRVAVRSLDFNDEKSFMIDDDRRGGEGGGWIEYLRGVAWALRDAGEKLRGWEGTLGGDVPRGAGLSSSAALELATARAFAAVSGIAWNPARMAKLAQKAENQWVGVNCGIMDQLISAVGEAGHAVLIDCRSLETRAVPLAAELSVVVLDTATRRGLVGSAYNERRAQCERAAAFFGVPALRDVEIETFEERAGALDPVTRKRARHVITENARTLDAARALERGEAELMGQLMNASHLSMRDDFEISRPEMDAMVEIAQAEPGCFGARMTGGGFGGCAVALVARDDAARFADEVARKYAARVKLEPAVYVCEASRGASLETGVMA